MFLIDSAASEAIDDRLYRPGLREIDRRIGCIPRFGKVSSACLLLEIRREVFDKFRVGYLISELLRRRQRKDGPTFAISS